MPPDRGRRILGEGLQRALEAIDAGEAVDLGTSGFSVREDTLGLVTPWSPGDPMDGGELARARAETSWTAGCLMDRRRKAGV